MVNAYSNVEDYFDDFVSTVTSRAELSVQAIDPTVKLIVALGAWQEKPLWYLPTSAHLAKEMDEIRHKKELLGIAYFKYGAKGSEWYMPSDATQLFELISK